ncbi:DNA replication/repair protein RecF [bacterium C-53]|nr:DNA replication/repair protein RecF [Lachnospiraceae bacterium]NBI03114.1 DNA replication/repair protein RecF [Lachnospiraceae bacterium]RKJ10720.1 DNA replication/repair protein RecF [bacterium C-53]
MVIRLLELENFRNYEKLHLEFDHSTNILFGDNAQGKTNILEAIYIAGTTKSHKSSKDKDVIKFNSEESHIRMVIEKKDIPYKIDMHLRKNKAKAIAVNGMPIKKAAELLGIVNIVFFSPEDLNIIKNGPSERRRFIDMELCQLDKFYLYNLTNYNKIVNQRNKLLKDITYNEDLRDTLDIWDSQLVSYGMKIIERRESFIQQLNDIVFSIHKKLSGGKEKINISYDPNVSVSQYEKNLKENREKDMKYKMTTVGPHRDDIGFYFEEVDIRKFGSQGQQRTAALSLKLSEIELVKRLTGDTPVLLLDDVLSELDNNRQNYLLNSINAVQTIVSCTGLEEFINNRFHINKIFSVVRGTVSDMPGQAICKDGHRQKGNGCWNECGT